MNIAKAYGIHRLQWNPVQSEGPIRSEAFVTRKIYCAAAAIKVGLQSMRHARELCGRGYG